MSEKPNACRMSDEAVLRFAELYRSSHCLWDATCDNYRSKEARSEAYKCISREMGIAGLGPREVARKIKNLTSAYHQEVRKVEASKRKSASGRDRVYRPTVVWFDLMDTFLGPVAKTGPRDGDTDSRSRTPCEDHRPSDRICISDSAVSPRTLEKASSINPPESSGDSAGSLDKNTTVRPAPVELSRSGAKRGRFSGDDCNAPARKPEVASRGFADRAEIDDYDSFGKYVAASLRRMPFEYGVSAESEIHDVIVKFKVYAMKKLATPSMRASTATATSQARPEERPFARGDRRSPASTFVPPPSFATKVRGPAHEPKASSSDALEPENASDSSRSSSVATHDDNDDRDESG